MDYVKLVRDIVEPLVAKPEALLIREIPSEKGKGHIQILVVAEANDTARLIGRGGGVA
ncbi:KH domain-containing protein, partial [bacterium]|nr:KH domain-containing protein [bacterium]